MSNECLIITAIGNPGSKEREIADRHYQIFSAACQMVGIVATRVDLLDAEVITPVLWEKLRSCQVAIADLSIPNPNASYELGIRHGIQMPTIIVTTDISTLPFDFKDFSVYQLKNDSSDVEELAKRVANPIREIQNTVFREWKFRIVPPSFVGEKNYNYYDTYMEALRNAKNGILMVSSGFDDDSPMALPYMRVLSGCAMRVSYTRIEAATPNKRNWLKMVANYLLPMSNFKLFAPRHPDELFLRDIGLIDWDDEQAALVQLMFHTSLQTGNPYDFSSKVVERAGYGFFCHSKQLASDLYNITMNMRKRGEIVPLKSPQDMARHYGFDEGWNTEGVADEKSMYFAYGSNLLTDQMKNRSSKYRSVGTAILMDYRLKFGIPGTIFSGAVANVVEEVGSSVYGVLYEVDALTIEKMDFFEGVEQGEYIREKVTVILCDSKQPVDAWVYLSKVKSTVIEKPSRIYLDRLVAGAIEHDLPENYISKLKKFESV